MLFVCGFRDACFEVLIRWLRFRCIGSGVMISAELLQKRNFLYTTVCLPSQMGVCWCREADSMSTSLCQICHSTHTPIGTSFMAEVQTSGDSDGSDGS